MYGPVCSAQRDLLRCVETVSERRGSDVRKWSVGGEHVTTSNCVTLMMHGMVKGEGEGRPTGLPIRPTNTVHWLSSVVCQWIMIIAHYRQQSLVASEWQLISTTVRYAVIICLHWQTVGYVVQNADIPQPLLAVLSLLPIVHIGPKWLLSCCRVRIEGWVKAVMCLHVVPDIQLRTDQGWKRWFFNVLVFYGFF